MSLLSMLLNKLRTIIHSDDFFQRNRTSETAFTRNSLLGFAPTVVYILWCARTSLPSTLRSFFNDKLNVKLTCTRQAFSKRRKLIKHEAFAELFEASATLLAKHLWKEDDEFPVFAIDGSRLSLPTHPELAEAFGIQKGTGDQIQALISTLHDVSNKVTFDLQIRPHNGNEREMALCHIRKIKELIGDKPFLLVYDRGYPSGKLLETMSNNSYFYLMRCPTEFVRALDKHVSDSWVTHKFHSLKKPITFRMVRVTLPNGVEEILCTNLSRNVGVEKLAKFYKMRWGIETNYGFIKNRIQLENLSGITYRAFMQQVYACLLMDNLCGAYYCDHRDEEIIAEPDSDRKCDKKINMAIVLDGIRGILPKVLVFPYSNLKDYLSTIDLTNLKNVFRYDRKGRDKTRTRRHPGMKFTQPQRSGC